MSQSCEVVGIRPMVVLASWLPLKRLLLSTHEVEIVDILLLRRLFVVDQLRDRLNKRVCEVLLFSLLTHRCCRASGHGLVGVFEFVEGSLTNLELMFNLVPTEKVTVLL